MQLVANLHRIVGTREHETVRALSWKYPCLDLNCVLWIHKGKSRYIVLCKDLTEIVQQKLGLGL